ncbi:inosine guanosine and xanthosine phosphorylase family protein [Mrakia frigida]|uniref:purine-nucleoside phosphorylase n=1 Tax=Mrakia frigida TaxID=29902 RepID=UPI003FCC2090
MSPTLSFPLNEAVSAILAAGVPSNLSSPKIGIICGSGLSGLSASLKEKFEVPYESIPGFLQSTVQGHKSSLAFGFLGDVPVVAMLGRFHPYEGHPIQETVFPVRVLKLLGVEKLIITNAAGGLNPANPVGTIIVINDHFSLPGLSGSNALMGPCPPAPFDMRFVPMSEAYSLEMRKAAFKAAHQLEFPREALAEGVYAHVSGPTYESRTEGRFLASLGCSAVGMSTVGEVVAARQAGLDVLVLSLITNAVIVTPQRSARDEVDKEIRGETIEVIAKEEASHEEVLEVGTRKAVEVGRLVERVVGILGGKY